MGFDWRLLERYTFKSLYHTNGVGEDGFIERTGLILDGCVAVKHGLYLDGRGAFTLALVKRN